MAIFKEFIDFDSSDPTEHDRIGSFLFGAGGTLVTSTTVGSDEALDVNVVGDSAVYNEDDPITEGGSGNALLFHRQDTLSSTTSADGDWGFGKQNSLGEIYVKDSDTKGALDLITVVEDAVAGDAYEGIPAMGVIQATLAATAGDGDFTASKYDSLGRLYTTTTLAADADDAAATEDPIGIGGVSHDQSSALGALSAGGDRGHMLMDLYRRIFVNNAANVAWKVTSETVGTTSGELVSTPLAGRTRVIIQNRSNKPIFIHPTTAVADGTAIRIPKYSSMQFPWGESLNIHAISTAAAQAVTVMEAA